MNNLFFLIPVALLLGATGLVAFIWALRSGQYEDMDGAAERILLEDSADNARPDGRRGNQNSVQGSATGRQGRR